MNTTPKGDLMGGGLGSTAATFLIRGEGMPRATSLIPESGLLKGRSLDGAGGKRVVTDLPGTPCAIETPDTSLHAPFEALLKLLKSLPATPLFIHSL